MVVFHDENGAGNQGGGIWMKDRDSSGAWGVAWLMDLNGDWPHIAWGSGDVVHAVWDGPNGLRWSGGCEPNPLVSDFHRGIDGSAGTRQTSGL